MLGTADRRTVAGVFKDAASAEVAVAVLRRHRQVKTGRRTLGRARQLVPGERRESNSSRQATDLPPGAAPFYQKLSPLRGWRAVPARAEMVAERAERHQEALRLLRRFEPPHHSLALTGGLV
jgi:hypothetical protein